MPATLASLGGRATRFRSRLQNPADLHRLERGRTVVLSAGFQCAKPVRNFGGAAYHNHRQVHLLLPYRLEQGMPAVGFSSAEDQISVEGFKQIQ